MDTHDTDMSGRGSDLALWERATTSYWRTVRGTAPPPGSNQRTEAARARNRVAAGAGAATVDLFVDPVCPYTWIVACWLREVARHREVDVRHHPMSLHLLNEGGVLDGRYASVIGPSRVATAVAVQHGSDALRAWHEAFGSSIFDRWRHPEPREYRVASLDALVAAGLSTDLVEAAEGDDHDEELRRRTEEAVRPVGYDVGTPIVHLDGVAFFGPILNAVPLGNAALRLFDGMRLVVGSPEFFELKRTRTSPPDVVYRPDGKERS
ncbi:mycothiol-dependent nitroreductase Rv2466c family protein [Nocardioides sediminis]|uniref:mycothiol-dependent nitroreductase Rv2466c family protein n=1 Tax=Nocardioides sediminis TaxID=433648 RepID=UPI001900A7F5|nr:disulfide bond formation protein DsbA [Nocardioides sediminis]